MKSFSYTLGNDHQTHPETRLTNQSRRTAFKTLLAGAGAASRPALPAHAAPPNTPGWGRGIEGQRKADRGDGT